MKKKEAKFLVDVGIRNVPFPIRVISKVDREGQHTVANISIEARIMQEFEARWIDKFIEILHSHRDCIGTKTLKTNIMDYLKGLNAKMVKAGFEFPFFVEKLTPVSKEKCLVRYLCNYSAKVSILDESPKIFLKMEVPAITTYPQADKDTPGGLFGQLTITLIEISSKKDIFPEDIVEIVDRHALSPVYSYMSKEDQLYLIEKIHSERKTSVEMADEIREELAHNPDIEWYSVRCFNFGMLRSYSTVIATEKSIWVPYSGYGESEI